MRQVRILSVIFLLSLRLAYGWSQIPVTDHKGTLRLIDTSKWQLQSPDIFFKNSGNVGIGVTGPTAKLHTSGSLRFQSLGNSTSNTLILTTDNNGNVATRSLVSFLDNNVVTTLNSLTNSVQFLNTGASGTDFNITSSGSTHTFNLPDASTSSRGALTSLDWNSFNNRISQVTTSAPIIASLTGTNVALSLNRNNILTGPSSGIATTPLTLSGGATNAVVGGSNVTFAVNNTAPLWNANQLQGFNLVNTAPASGQLLRWNGTAWAPSDDNLNWLITGNSNAVYNTNFLGTTNDVPMTIRSNNTAMLEVGRRQTLGLYDNSSTGLFPYNQQNASVAYIRGTGGNSALQFESSGATFYKPIFFTDSDGNFMMRGSSAGTDFFELGSAGNSNNGSLIFTIGDDGDEPMIFRKYNYSPEGYIEMMRLQGTGLNATVRTGINMGGNTPNSTFQVVGSQTKSIVNTSTAITLNETHHTVIVTANVNVTLPAANTCTGRYYIIKKTFNGTSTMSSYVDTNASNSTSLVRGVYHLQSDGTNWQRLN